MANPMKLKASVESVKEFGEGTYQVRFIPQGAIPRFKPGQFLHLTLDEYNPAGGFWPESRVFSIASAPGAARIEVVYSVKGKYTRRMEEGLKPGCEVWLKLPYGSFIIDSALAPGQDAVLVAGGTGISPFLPYIAKRCDAGGLNRTVRLYYGVRDNSHFLAREALASSAAAGLLDVRLFVENEDPDEAMPRGLIASRGRLSIEQIYGESRKLENPAFFLSGPPAMIASFKGILLESSVEPSRILIDEWE